MPVLLSARRLTRTYPNGQGVFDVDLTPPPAGEKKP